MALSARQRQEIEAFEKRVAHEARFTREMRRQINIMLDAYVNNVKQNGGQLNLSGYLPDVIAILRSNYRKIGKTHSSDAQQQFGQAPKPLRDKINHNLERQYNTQSLQTAQQIINTTQKQANNGLNKARLALVAAGGIITLINLGNELQKQVADSASSRAESIATTETTKAIGIAKQTESNTLNADAEYKANNLQNKQIYHRWNSLLDGRERESHHNADGQLKPPNLPYMVGDVRGVKFPLFHPGDSSLGAPVKETANCRCYETYELL